MARHFTNRLPPAVLPDDPLMQQASLEGALAMKALLPFAAAAMG